MSEQISPQISGYELLRVSIDWHGQVVLSWTADEANITTSIFKESFKQFYNYYERLDGTNFIELRRLEDTFEKLCVQAQKTEEKSEFIEFFSVYMGALTNILQPTENLSEMNSYGEGYEGLKVDFQQEMERLSRDGKEFCICLVGACDKKQESRKAICDLASAELRGFDRVFQLDANQIAISLKQTDKNGASRFLKRTQNKLFGDSGIKFNAVISQPVAGELLSSILTNLKKDLVELQANVSGDIVILQELSPLERHLKEIGSQ